MKNRPFVTILTVCVLISAAVSGALAQPTSVLGVKPGDNFTYSFEVLWTSTDPNQIVPQQFSDMNRTISIRLNVTDVGPTIAYVNVTNTMRDGSVTSAQGFIEVASGRGEGAQLLIIGANLTAGDQAYPQSEAAAVAAGAAAAPFTITDTVNKTYLGSVRTTNHYSERVTNSTTGDYIDRNAYYDRDTGILLEMTIQHYFESVGETDTEHWKIIQFNSAAAPSDGTDGGTNGTGSTSDWSSWLVPIAIVVVVVIVAVFVAVVLLRRRGKPQAQAPPQTPPQTTA